LSLDKHNVLLLAAEPPGLDFSASVLGKPVVKLRTETEPGGAIEAIGGIGYQLVVVDAEIGRMTASVFLEAVKQNLPIRPPFILVGARKNLPGPWPFAVRPQAAEEGIEAFDRAIIQALGMQLRRARRYLVRLTFVDSAEQALLGFSCSISTSGVLLATPKNFPPLTRVQLEIKGVKELSGLIFDAMVLREEAPPEGQDKDQFYHALQFQTGAGDAMHKLADYLKTLG
jgi:hypothetical protein